jgi:DNA mismatch repair protein MutS
MNYTKEILIKDYFDIHNFYSDIYGINRTIILIQVGSFHEIYSTDNEGINLIILAQELDITCTMKNNKIPLSKTNPRMVGFPIYTTQNYIDKLIELNYTIVLINQVSPPPNPTRKVVNIYSPSTYIEKNTTKINYLVSIVLNEIKNNLCIGITAYDLSTGEGSVYETYSTPYDKYLGLDNILRFLEKYPPREIILHNENIIDLNDILNYLNIDIKNIYIVKIINHKKIQYQKELLDKVYNNSIDNLHLEFNNLARLSLILLLDYVISHQNNLIYKLKEPKIFNHDDYLYLGNRALEQLSINNLFNIINFTKTVLGKKYLNNQIKMPLNNNNKEELQLRYNLIKYIIDNNHYEKISNYLEDIYDLDKIIRKLEIGIINPSELYNLYLSFYQIEQLSKYFNKYNILELFNINEKMYKSINKIIEWINKYFILEKINNVNFNNFTETDTSFYKKNIHPEIDNIQNNIDISQNFMLYLINELEKYINDKKIDNLITLKHNDREGHYLLITNRRCNMLKTNLQKINKILIGNIELNINDLEFNELPKSSNTKITCKKLKELSLENTNYKIQLAKLLKEKFYNDIEIFSNKYCNIIYKWSNKIAYIDFINNGAVCAIKYHYSMPIIENREYSFFSATELRHPIVENIKTDTEYIPHNIELGCNTSQNGILLYGINSSGKSTLMKSIAINIILAQIGYFVAATRFIYNPYNSLFTRIGNNDNIFKGQSSFVVEMTELISILKRNNNHTLIVADEIASGSEIKSANIIICYMLENLSSSNSSFITATHLHNIASMECIKKLDNIKVKHLKLSYDEKNDILIYDRNLLDGQGETFYGLQVAKYLMKNTHFNQRTSEILQEYENNNIKKCKYNSKIYMDSKCNICNNNEKLETHHIIWQKDFDKNNINYNKFYLQKNNESNLVTLCSICHDKVDRNEIIINGWKETSNGKIFDYIISNNVIKNNKYNEDIINYINDIQNDVFNDARMARIKIKEQFNIKISTKTILNIWNK